MFVVTFTTIYLLYEKRQWFMIFCHIEIKRKLPGWLGLDHSPRPALVAKGKFDRPHRNIISKPNLSNYFERLGLER